MASESSDVFPVHFTILIAGGFGVGKTTLVRAVSEVEPLTTEETLTTASVGTDSVVGVEGKTTTTVAMDFGRITFSEQNMVLYLSGSPGRHGFWFMWDELSRGALGALVLVDTRRLEDCFAAIEFFERRDIRFVVAINEFDHAYRYPDKGTCPRHCALKPPLVSDVTLASRVPRAVCWWPRRTRFPGCHVSENPQSYWSEQ